MYLLFVVTHQCIAWHTQPLMSFSVINKISTSVNNSNSTPVFFKHACHANPGAEKSELDQAHVFQYICCKNFQIHLQVITYRFKRTNHDNHQDVLFKSFSIPF